MYSDIKFKNLTFFADGQITTSYTIGRYWDGVGNLYRHLRYEFNTGNYSGTECSIGCDADKTSGYSLQLMDDHSANSFNTNFKLYYTISTDPNAYCDIKNNLPTNGAPLKIMPKWEGTVYYILTSEKVLNYNLYPATTYYLWIYPVFESNTYTGLFWPSTWANNSAAIQISVSGVLNNEISYNLNGGSGSGFSVQTKAANESIALHTAVPQRKGYLFQGWALTSSGRPLYQPGDIYTDNVSITLYAIWAPIVSYQRYIPYIYAGGKKIRFKTYINSKDTQIFQQYIPSIEMRALYAEIGATNRNIFVYTNAEPFDLKFQIQQNDNVSQSINATINIVNLITNNEEFNRSVQNIKIPANGNYISATIPFTKIIYGIFKITIKIYTGSDEVASVEEIFCRIKAPQNKQSFIGMNLHIPNENDTAKKLIDMAAKTGMSIWRISIPWASVEKTKGNYEIPTLAINAIDKAIQLGLQPLIILAHGNELYGEINPYNDTWRAAYANYCTYIATQLKNKVQYFEVWNEWNANIGKVPIEYRNGNAYAKVLCDAYTAIKTSNPAAKVIGGAVAGAVEEWLHDLFRDEENEEFIFDYMDIFSFHTYPLTPINNETTGFVNPDIYNYTQELQKICDLMDEYYGIIPIWLTETGWPTHTGTDFGYKGVSEEEQAAYLIQLYAQMSAIKDEYCIQNICWYDMMNDGVDKLNPQDNFGLLYSYLESDNILQFTPKPGYIALGALCAIFEEIDNGKTINILWDNGNSLTYICGNNEIILDMYGNEITRSAGTQILLTYKPIYVIHN